MFLRIQLTIFQHWQWLGAGQATSHCLNQCWLVLLTHICVTQPQWVNAGYLSAIKSIHMFCIEAGDSSQPLYKQLGIMKFSDLKILECTFYVSICYSNSSRWCYLPSQRNNEYHNHETGTVDQFHIPAIASDSCQTDIRFGGAILCYAVLSNYINKYVCEAVYGNFLKKLIDENEVPWIYRKVYVIMYLVYNHCKLCHHCFE